MKCQTVWHENNVSISLPNPTSTDCLQCSSSHACSVSLCDVMYLFKLCQSTKQLQKKFYADLGVCSDWHWHPCVTSSHVQSQWLSVGFCMNMLMLTFAGFQEWSFFCLQWTFTSCTYLSIQTLSGPIYNVFPVFFILVTRIAAKSNYSLSINRPTRWITFCIQLLYNQYPLHYLFGQMEGGSPNDHIDVNDLYKVTECPRRLMLIRTVYWRWQVLYIKTWLHL